ARVLIAEDNEVNRRIAVLFLERLGYRTEVTCDGREAVTAFARAPHDLILMDLQMPHLDGFDATRAIRASGPEGARVPIVAMTATATPGDRRRCLAAGMDEHIAKPINADVLARILSACLPDAAPAPPSAPSAERRPAAAADPPPIDLERLRDLCDS